MSKEAIFNGWVSIPSSKMIESWIKRRFITNAKILDFCEADANDKHGDIAQRLSLLDENGRLKDFKWAKDKKEIKKYKKLGYRNDKKLIVLLDDKIYHIMRDEVNKWYDGIFNYVEEWLFKNGLLHIERGSLQTGFCVESDPNHEVVKNWGAPLGKKNNKVAQMKEKFGRVTVYFYGLTNEEDVKVRRFAKEVERKFDCVTDFC